MGKKYLIRAGYHPLDQYSLNDALYNNITGWNSGNLLYAYGVFNVLYDGENELVSTYYRTDFSDKEIDYINETYDAFILPLADAFRTDWVHNLDAYTDIINKLQIPCIVIGACLRAPINSSLNAKYPFDESVKKFVSAVLEKSSVIGLRGHRTCEYLRNLGFSDEKQIRAIGCPSLYTYGNTVKTKELKNSGDIVLNFNPNVSEEVNKFFYKSYSLSNKANLILQEMGEFKNFYYGIKMYEWNSKEFPYSTLKKIAGEDCIKYFFDPQQWYEYVSNFDLSIGTRFHGTVANILGGIPHVIVPLDSRMQELVEFHNITHIDMEKVRGSVYDYLEDLDFKQFENKQNKNLENYKDFLNINGIKSVFDKEIDISRGNSPMEKERQMCTENVSTYYCVDYKEKISRRMQLASQLINTKRGKKDLFNLDGRF